MREWQLKANDPLTLTLAADARLSNTDYVNDHVWQLSLKNGSPPALALTTTFGLRARLMRMFPRFSEGDLIISDPELFPDPSNIQVCLPNYIRLVCSPLAEIELTAEYWAPLSQAICGKMTIKNLSQRNRQVRVDWIGQLTPTEGQRLAPQQMQGVAVLTGQTADLAPLIFLTNGPKHGSGSYPCLSLAFDLSPGNQKDFTWIQAALKTQEASFALARSLAASRWEAERTRIEMINANQLEISTGNRDWDTCFMLSQNVALGLFQSPSAGLPNPALVHCRQPDHGYSMRGDGSDYNHLWNGQSILDVYAISQVLSSAAPNLVVGLLENFLAVQEPDGFIDMKPGFSGYRSRLLATPLLSYLFLRMDGIVNDPEFLQKAFPKLLAFFKCWFNPQNDRDQDGLPEWTHPIQSGVEDHATYSPWNKWSKGVDITKVETPALGAFLYKECLSLIKICQKTGNLENIPYLEQVAVSLHQAVENSWVDEQHAYLDWDRDTHLHPVEELLAQTTGPGLILLEREFETPVRLLIHIFPHSSKRPDPQFFIHGENATGLHRIEALSGDQFRWTLERGCFTGDYVYSRLEHIEIRNLEPGDNVQIYLVGLDHQDQSQFTPLWAGIPSHERAVKMIEESLLNPDQFWKPHGVPVCTGFPVNGETQICQASNFIWNQIVGEGLLAYGYREKAAELVTRIMQTIIESLRAQSCFRQNYDAITGQGLGENNAVSGLAPLDLFMDTLGVRFLSASRLMITGFNPYPWPISIKYKGTQVDCQRDLIIIQFANGQVLRIDDPSPRMISME